MNEARYSYLAIHKLTEKGHPVVAIGLREGEVAGVSFSSEQKAFENIHTVTLYIGAKHQAAYYEYILSLKPRRVIFNPGTQNSTFYDILLKNNIAAEVACTLVLLSTNYY